MAYRVKSGRVLKWEVGVYGREYWVDVGPAEKMTIFDKALCIMMKHEQRGTTGSVAYCYAQRVARDWLCGSRFT